MDEKEMIQQTFEMTRDNNRMLHAMRRNAFFGGLMRLAFWVIIIGGPIVFYYAYAAPYVDQMLAAYAGIKGDVQSIKDVTNKIPNLGDLNIEGLLKQAGQR